MVLKRGQSVEYRNYPGNYVGMVLGVILLREYFARSLWQGSTPTLAFKHQLVNKCHPQSSEDPRVQTVIVEGFTRSSAGTPQEHGKPTIACRLLPPSLQKCIFASDAPSAVYIRTDAMAQAFVIYS